VFLILDRLRVHRARLTRSWLAEHEAEIKVFYLPSYSPDPPTALSSIRTRACTPT
jgi:DDE superfamily endonuclease